MRRYVVVAHRTFAGEHLLEHLRSLRREGPCQLHLVVPVVHPIDHAWTEGGVVAIARERLDSILEMMASMGIGASGEVGDANPVYAVDTALRHLGEPVHGIIISTLPREASRWWGMDAPSRLRRAHPELEVTHLVAEPALAF